MIDNPFSDTVVPNGVSRNVAIAGRLLDRAGNDIVRLAGVIPCNQTNGFQLSACCPTFLATFEFVRGKMLRVVIALALMVAPFVARPAQGA